MINLFICDVIYLRVFSIIPIPNLRLVLCPGESVVIAQSLEFMPMLQRQPVSSIGQQNVSMERIQIILERPVVVQKIGLN